MRLDKRSKNAISIPQILATDAIFTSPVAEQTAADSTVHDQKEAFIRQKSKKQSLKPEQYIGYDHLQSIFDEDFSLQGRHSDNPITIKRPKQTENSRNASPNRHHISLINLNL